MDAFGLPAPSPQLGATAYGRPAPFIDRGAFVESQAAFLQQLKLQQRQEEAFDERLRMEREARADARRDANIALGLKGAELGYSIGRNPTVQRYGKQVIDALKPKPVPATPSLPMTPIGEVNPLTGAVSANANATSIATPVASTAVPAASTGFQGVLPKLGGEGLASSAGNFAIKAGVPAVASYAIERSNFGESMNKRLGGGEKTWDDIGTSLSSFAFGGPIGLGANLARIGFRELKKLF